MCKQNTCEINGYLSNIKTTGPLVWVVKEWEWTQEMLDTSSFEVNGTMYFDYKLMFDKALANAVVVPDLKNKELQKIYGVTTPEALLLKMLPDEESYVKLHKAIVKIN